MNRRKFPLPTVSRLLMTHATSDRTSRLACRGETAAWQDACRRAEAGEKVDVPHHYWAAEGGAVLHIAYEPWGIGISYGIDDDAEADVAEVGP